MTRQFTLLSTMLMLWCCGCASLDREDKYRAYLFSLPKENVLREYEEIMGDIFSLVENDFRSPSPRGVRVTSFHHGTWLSSRERLIRLTLKAKADLDFFEALNATNRDMILRISSEQPQPSTPMDICFQEVLIPEGTPLESLVKALNLALKEQIPGAPPIRVSNPALLSNTSFGLVTARYVDLRAKCHRVLPIELTSYAVSESNLSRHASGFEPLIDLGSPRSEQSLLSRILNYRYESNASPVLKP